MNNEILFLGDVFLPNPFKLDFKISEPFIFNLESPITKSNKPAVSKINLKTEEDYINKTLNCRPIAVNLANNHILDYGDDGFEDTLVHLNKEGIMFFGAGEESNNFQNPLILDMDNAKIGLLGYCYTTNNIRNDNVYNPAPLVEERIIKDIKNTKLHADKVILNLHWGEEEEFFPNEKQIIVAKRFIDEGVDLIIGHHTHVIQPVLRYSKKYIGFGLGNFIFPDLDVDSYYDEKGVPSRTFKKKQAPWNRSSLGIKYDYKSNDVKFSYYFSKKSEVYKKRNMYHFIAFWDLSKKRIFKSSLRLQKIKKLMGLFYYSNWFNKPRFPSVNTLKRVFRILK